MERLKAVNGNKIGWPGSAIRVQLEQGPGPAAWPSPPISGNMGPGKAGKGEVIDDGKHDGHDEGGVKCGVEESWSPRAIAFPLLFLSSQFPGVSCGKEQLVARFDYT
jgi:hypothetical protein